MESCNGSLKRSFEEWIIIQLGRHLRKTLNSYHQVREAKIKYCSKAVFQGCFRKKQAKNPRRYKKKICGGGQNLKHYWPLVWRFVKWMTYIYDIHEETTRNLKLKLFIFLVSESIYISFNLLYILKDVLP